MLIASKRDIASSILRIIKNTASPRQPSISIVTKVSQMYKMHENNGSITVVSFLLPRAEEINTKIA